jgi:two-component system response regulator FixJ
MTDRITVALIDDDEDVLDALASFLERRGIFVMPFSASPPFLEAIDAGGKFDCVVSDVRMPQMSGLELQRILNGTPSSLPLVLITGHGDVDMAVTSLKAGAADFIEKPTDDERLLASIKSAVSRNREVLWDEAELTSIRERYEQLSERQREVMGLAIRGLSNKKIAAQLGISPRTVEHYREWAMERMQAGNFAELVQMAAQLKLLTRSKRARAEPDDPLYRGD